MIDLLEKILNRVSDNIRLAEAKNSIILTISAGCVVGLISSYSIRSGHLNHGYSAGNLISAALFLIALTISAYSFMPHLRNTHRLLSPQPSSANVFFFEDLKTLSEDQLLEQIGSPADLSEIEVRIARNMANQVVVTAQIASEKFRSFRRSVFFLFLGAISVVTTLTLELAGPHLVPFSEIIYRLL